MAVLIPVMQWRLSRRLMSEIIRRRHTTHLGFLHFPEMDRLCSKKLRLTQPWACQGICKHTYYHILQMLSQQIPGFSSYIQAASQNQSRVPCAYSGVGDPQLHRHQEMPGPVEQDLSRNDRRFRSMNPNPCAGVLPGPAAAHMVIMKNQRNSPGSNMIFHHMKCSSKI